MSVKGPYIKHGERVVCHTGHYVEFAVDVCRAHGQYVVRSEKTMLHIAIFDCELMFHSLFMSWQSSFSVDVLV